MPPTNTLVLKFQKISEGRLVAACMFKYDRDTTAKERKAQAFATGSTKTHQFSSAIEVSYAPRGQNALTLAKVSAVHNFLKNIPLDKKIILATDDADIRALSETFQYVELMRIYYADQMEQALSLPHSNEKEEKYRNKKINSVQKNSKQTEKLITPLHERFQTKMQGYASYDIQNLDDYERAVSVLNKTILFKINEITHENNESKGYVNRQNLNR